MPAAAGFITDFVRRIARHVLQTHGVAVVGQGAKVRPRDGGGRILGGKCRGICRHHQITLGGDLHRTKVEVNPSAQFPSIQAHGRSAAVVQLDPFFGMVRDPGGQKLRGMLIHDFIDHDAFRN